MRPKKGLGVGWGVVSLCVCGWVGVWVGVWGVWVCVCVCVCGGGGGGGGGTIATTS